MFIELGGTGGNNRPTTGRIKFSSSTYECDAPTIGSPHHKERLVFSLCKGSLLSEKDKRGGQGLFSPPISLPEAEIVLHFLVRVCSLNFTLLALVRSEN